MCRRAAGCNDLCTVGGRGGLQTEGARYTGGACHYQHRETAALTDRPGRTDLQHVAYSMLKQDEIPQNIIVISSDSALKTLRCHKPREPNV